VIGLAFKAGTDDLRESPMVALVEALIARAATSGSSIHDVALTRLIGATALHHRSRFPHIAR